jgi:hypothetical protein
MGTRDLLLLIGFLRNGKMFPSALSSKELGVERSLKIVLDGMAQQERSLFGRAMNPSDRDDLRRRAALTTWSGEALTVGTRIGEIPDPGILVVLLYAAVKRDEAGRPVFEPRPASCRETLLGMVRQDLDMASKLDRHLKSADASIKARFDEA